jgi:phosphopantetheinyl transferase
MSAPRGIQAISELYTTQVSCMTVRVFTVNAARNALWQDGRRACDKALAQGFAFVVILREAGVFADEHLLTDEDRERAKRFRRAGDRYNFVLGRTVVHHLVRPADASAPCAFSLGRNGKPFLPGCPTYNLSHSGSWVACVISRSELVGIDVEAFEHLQDYRDLVTTITHPAEHRIIDQTSPDRRLALFKRCWTRKEAVLKATGKGLSDDLCSIDVRLAESEPVLSYPVSLRLVDLLVEDERVTISLALDTSIPGIVVMPVL